MLLALSPASVCFLSRTSLARPGLVIEGAGRCRGAEENTQAGRPREGVAKQALEGPTSQKSAPPFAPPPGLRVRFCPHQGETQYSSHSSSNTLSSNASSNHSDERWFDGGERGGGGCAGDPADPDPDPLSKGGSNDSGIDASTPYNNNARHGNTANKAMHCFAGYSSGGDTRRRESSPVVPAAANQNKGYRTRTFPPPGSSADKMDAFKPR